MREPDYDLIIFDCDGVLIDSEVISAQTLIALVRPFGIEIDAHYVQENFLGRSFPTVASIIRSDFDIALPNDFEASYRSNLLTRFDTELKPTPGIEAVLSALSVDYCVATSSSPERALRSLSMTDLVQFFDASIYTASEVKRGKPAPDLFLHVAQDRGVPVNRCLVIEDSLAGVEAGLAAEMAVLRYVGGMHFSGIAPRCPDHIQSVRTFDSWANFADTLAAEAGSPSDDG